jgi:NAD(P)-dependent dehydrogenase (short-subunit alcohol dehydrogenase family)
VPEPSPAQSSEPIAPCDAGPVGRDGQDDPGARPSAETVRADIRDIAKLRRIADQIDQQFGKIDIVVANAAIQHWKLLLEMDSDWRDVIGDDLNGIANAMRALAPKMVAKKNGRILVFSSMQGNPETKQATSYSVSKSGVLGLIKSAAL